MSLPMELPRGALLLVLLAVAAAASSAGATLAVKAPVPVPVPAPAPAHAPPQPKDAEGMVLLSGLSSLCSLLCHIFLVFSWIPFSCRCKCSKKKDSVFF